MIARKEPYCLFLDELNACTQEVQKAFYSLIHEQRIGEYELPKGSIVVGAGNAQTIDDIIHCFVNSEACQMLCQAKNLGRVNYEVLAKTCFLGI